MARLTCRKCGKLFEALYLGDEYCEDCSAAVKDKYHEVRDYLWDHPNSTASTVAKACGVSVHQVMLWVRDERLEVSEDSKVSLYCEKCGTRILSGRFCSACQKAAGKAAEESARAKQREEHASHIHGTGMGPKGGEDGKMRYF
ncbi:MAG: hypothetical protein K5985_04280 [Lachnospiraceae bacterium]|nr:hypothetical protein [Lachnospiraceae bacterium]